METYLLSNFTLTAVQLNGAPHSITTRRTREDENYPVEEIKQFLSDE